MGAVEYSEGWPGEGVRAVVEATAGATEAGAGVEGDLTEVAGDVPCDPLPLKMSRSEEAEVPDIASSCVDSYEYSCSTPQESAHLYLDEERALLLRSHLQALRSSDSEARGPRQLALATHL